MHTYKHNNLLSTLDARGLNLQSVQDGLDDAAYHDMAYKSWRKVLKGQKAAKRQMMLCNG